ncbi:Ig-like domain-containing protein [Cohnella thermotolerans]|uniref:RCC1 domain-containing protein n=1 Tax=Cohnella thermotolerans TaxID=329858 RepID=UPI000423F808|nr:Ig-like domain-containing protein [Cohnella thermotolerans]
MPVWEIRFRKAATWLLCLFLLWAGSASQVYSASEAGPVIVGSTPSDNKQNVPVDSIIHIAFDEPIEQSVNFSIITAFNQNKLEQLPVDIAINGNELTLSPRISLEYGNLYKIYIPTDSVRNASGIGLADTYTIEFSTLPEALSVTSTEPMNEESGIALEVTPIVSFNLPIESVDEAGIVFKSEETSVPVRIEKQENQLMIVPEEKLAPAVTYTLSIEAGSVAARNGQTLNEPITVSFTTVENGNEAPSEPSSLKVVSVSPEDHQKDVGLDASVTIDFDSPIQEGKAYTDIRMFSESESGDILFAAAIAGNRLTIKPDRKLASLASFTISLPQDAVRSVDGETPNEAFSVTFETEDQPAVEFGSRLFAGSGHTVYLDEDGTVWTWGSNRFGELGNGATQDSPLPVQVIAPAEEGEPLAGVTAVGGGSNHSFALTADGAVWAWGENDAGQLGDGTSENRSKPVQVVGGDGTGTLSGIVAISGGDKHTLALDADGTVWSWGLNVRGQLGDGSLTDRSIPVRVKDATGEGILSDVVAISAGASFSLALKGDGTVWAWGDNNFGQLGDGTTTDRSLPVQVQAVGGTEPLAGVVSIAGGAGHAAALLSDGTVWSWGDNAKGQLGEGTNVNSLLPVQVKTTEGQEALSDIIAIGSGIAYSAALRADGAVWAWGDNASGQLGDGTAIDRANPVEVVGTEKEGTLAGVKDLRVGGDHIVIRNEDNSILSWGNNAYGQLGNDSTANFSYPVELTWIPKLTVVSSYPEQNGTVATLTPMIQLKFNHEIQEGDGYENIVLQTDGQTVELAQEIVDNELRLTPKEPLLPNATYILTIPQEAVGSDDVDSQGGDTVEPSETEKETNNTESLPDNSSTNSADPSSAEGTTTETALFKTKEVHTLTATSTSSIYTLTFKTVAGTAAVKNTIAAGSGYSLVVKLDGSVWSTGDNYYGELGDGTTADRSELVRVKNSDGTGFLSDVYSVSTQFTNSVALKTDGTVWSWGNNGSGQVGDGTTTNRLTPVQVLGSGGNGFLNNVIAISSGGLFNLALKSDGTVWSWGNNSVGQLGVGKSRTSLSLSKFPVQVVNSDNTGGLTNVVAISAGSDHALALKADGTVWSWGENVNGQLGTGSAMDSNKPIQVKGVGGTGALTNVIGIAAGNGFSLALASDGTVWSWGLNDDGQLGNGTLTKRSTPVQVLDVSGTGGLSGVIAISASRYFSVALKSDGTVVSWGYNQFGQLGNNSTVTSKRPVQVLGSGGTGALNGVTEICAGTFHVIALKSDGMIWGWGRNGDGELGNGSTTNSFIPVSLVNQVLYRYFYNASNQVTEFSFYQGIVVYRRLYTYDLNGNLINTTTARFTL